MTEQEKRMMKTGPFDTQSVAKVMNKARTTSIIRNIIISTIVSIIVLIGGNIGNSLIANLRGWDAFKPIEWNAKITGPNVYLARPTFQYGFLGGTLNYKTFKVIENRVIPWDDPRFEFNVFKGQATRLVGGGSGIQVIEEDQLSRFYNESNGKREMLFYHPSLPFQQYVNDVALLDQVNDDKYIEMGLSFDKGYTLDQVNEMLPKTVHPTWYWANSFLSHDLEILKEVQEPLRAASIYGFHAYRDRLNPLMKTTEEQFFQDVQRVASSKNIHYSEPAQKVYQAIAENQKKGLIIGVVVTGTKDQLKSLKGLPFIKAATLGATVDKF
ncbi:anti sigma factor C-terminal domain-containing protein [Brevibacillus sp. NRS-1366]|uniref:anti sigma factor C-terminal domain-containing protein n=1 Tax=Brevibacillus sp. NRS-1366 TaxID=3233899 RepID=UPI003D1F475F